MQQLHVGQYTTAVAVTPSDTAPVTFRAIYVGGTGNLAVRMEAGAAVVTFTGVVAGSIIPVECDRVMSSNTTATNLIGLI